MGFMAAAPFVATWREIVSFVFAVRNQGPVNKMQPGFSAPDDLSLLALPPPQMLISL